MAAESNAVECHAAEIPAADSRTRTVRWAAVLLAVVTAACTAACAGPPSTGDVRTAVLSQSHNNVYIVAREPTAGMNPKQLVEGFLQALTGDQKDPAFSVARDYLTPDARKTWITPGQTWDPDTKIVNTPFTSEDPGVPADHISFQQEAGVSTATPSVGAQETVTVSGGEVADLDPYGFLSYQSQQQPVQQPFTVKYLGAGTGWRIETPPKFRIISAEAFRRAYQTYQSALPVYLPTQGSAAPQMDQVYLTQATGKVDFTYNALARAVLQGRYHWQTSPLQLAGPVTISQSGAATVATVTLQVPPAGQRDITDVEHALALTFRDATETQQLVSSTPLTAVDVTYAGCTTCGQHPLPPDTTQVPSVYWMCAQGQNGSQSALVMRPLSPPAAPQSSGSAAACPANGKAQSAVDLSGVQRGKDSPVAVKQAADSADLKSPTPATVAAVVDTAGNVVVISDKNPSDHKTWYTAASAAKVSDLEWDPVDGSLWVVDNGNLYRVQDPGAKGPSVDPQKVVLVSGGQLTKFKPSPDGYRAIVVTGQSSFAVPSPVAMVTIDRSGGVPSVAPDTAFPLLNGTLGTDALQTATDAAWADGRTVVVLGVPNNSNAADTSNTAKLFKVYLDGTQDSAIGAPDDAQPTAKYIAAATAVTGGHASLWVVSDGTGATDSGGTGSYVYFKKSGSTDSYQELGSTPVEATQAPN
jgi:hypothetical protein